MYGKGQGVIQDNIHAYMWLIIAASNGNAGAVESIELVEGVMSASQIREARALALECVTKNFKGC